MKTLNKEAPDQETPDHETPDKEVLWQIASRINDPEIPVLSIAELGILRAVELIGERVKVTITPTYSGCPAMETIRDDLLAEFAREGFSAEIELVLSPAWTTDWMTESGKAKLAGYGIAPPSGRSGLGSQHTPVRLALAVKCPLCDSLNTRELTRFGSTSCKALYKCQDCLEPFDYFKVH
ncbi:1,2-phenylacetyl-CoA epoxidase subunit PaaD [Psychromicrobium sp. YIM B11713]|uniref:1,2-phenylacetyl-CoA epoxidase subunit PaaD n=1 Tax=Psychromicrobium sp. YIM B11713 TaxID=3145233 RepID=UPI00374EC991